MGERVEWSYVVHKGEWMVVGEVGRLCGGGMDGRWDGTFGVVMMGALCSVGLLCLAAVMFCMSRGGCGFSVYEKSCSSIVVLGSVLNREN